MEESKYIVKLTKNQLIAGLTTFVSLFGGGGLLTTKMIFETAVAKETQIQIFEKQIEYEKQIHELKDELNRFKLASNMSEERMAEIIDNKTFLLIHSQYLISHNNYQSNPTPENLKYIKHIQEEYKRYVKHKKLEIVAQEHKEGFQFFGNQVRVIEGIIYHIPKDITMGE